MLRSLRTKLFLALLSVNALLACVVFLAATESFRGQFKGYLHARVSQSLEEPARRLAVEYRRNSGWDRVISDPSAWARLVGRPRPDGSPAGAGMPSGEFLAPLPTTSPLQDEPPAPRDSMPSGSSTRIDELDFEDLPPPPMHRIALLDAEDRLLIGRRFQDAEFIARDIVVDGRRVGAIGISAPREIVAALDRALVARITWSFAVIAGGMLAATIFAVALVAWFTTRPLQALTQGARALAQGHYEVQIAVPGRDELASLAEQFNHLARELRDSQEARRRQVADVAHELRTPVAVLRGELEALEDGVRTIDHASISSLRSEVARLTRLIDDLQTLYLFDAKALVVRPDLVDIGAVVQATVAANQGAIERSGLNVVVTPSPGCMLEGDAGRLQQLFANLMQNSVRYTDRGGTVRISITEGDGKVRIEWEDSAPGVPEAVLPRLTERLFRVDGSRARASGGAGLGLAIARAIVETHGGEMRASASPLGGLRWSIELPKVWGLR